MNVLLKLRNNLISLSKINKGEHRREINFHRCSKAAFFLSWIVVAIGVSSVYSNKDKILGIDFRGGEELIASFEQQISPEEIENCVNEIEYLGEVQHVYRSEIGTGESSSRLVLQTETDKSRVTLDELNKKYPYAKLEEVGLSNIGASVSDKIKWDAIISVLVALIGILLYGH